MPTILEVLQESLEALKAGGFPAGGDVYDNLAQAITQLKRNAPKALRMHLEMNMEQALQRMDRKV